MPGRSMPGLVGTGTKRKRDEAEDGLEGSQRLATCSQVCSYTLQRQCVLNLSVCKLQMSRQQVEPPLRRSVLICNTLRQIERELRAEGRHYDCSRVSMLISNQPLCLDAPNKESIPSATPEASSISSPSPDSRGCPSDRSRVNDENVSPAMTRCAQSPTEKGSLSVSNSRLVADSATLESSKTTNGSDNNNCLQTIANRTNVPSHLDTAPHPVASNASSGQTRLTDKLSTIVVQQRDVTSVRQEHNSCLDTTPSIINAASTDIMEFGDEIFGDIDVSLYDFDLSSPFIPNHTPNPNPKPPSPSTTPDDWLRSFQGDVMGFTTDMPSPGAQGNCRSDLIDELDQIMHILVDVGM